MDDDRDTEPMEIPVVQDDDAEMWLDVGDHRSTRAATSSEWPPAPQPPASRTERRAAVFVAVRRPPTSS